MKIMNLYSALSEIDEELIQEATEEQKKRRVPVMKATVTAAIFCLLIISAAIVAGLNNQQNHSDKDKRIIAGNTDEQEADVIEHSQATDMSETTISLPEKAESNNMSEHREEKPNRSSNTQPEDEECDILGFIVKDGKTYIQVFETTEFTSDKEIGFARDFAGSYRDPEDNSKVYTVKEDERILMIRLSNGGTVILMQLNEEDTLGYYRFNGIRADRSLMAALLSNDGKAYRVEVTRPDSEDMYEYQYKGKTLGDLKSELEESWKYQHGKNNPYEDEYQAGLDAFHKERIHKIYGILKDNHIKVELVNGVRCEAEVTKKQLEDFSNKYHDLDEYAFSLLSSGYFTDDPEA